ncbi:MAG: hypothetical protein ACQEQE_05585 [Bacillota bacterium]
MRYNFKKFGIKLLIMVILILVLLKYMNVSLNIRLFLGTFGIGSSLFLIFFSKFDPPEDDSKS